MLADLFRSVFVELHVSDFESNQLQPEKFDEMIPQKVLNAYFKKSLARLFTQLYTAVLKIITVLRSQYTNFIQKVCLIFFWFEF